MSQELDVGFEKIYHQGKLHAFSATEITEPEVPGNYVFGTFNSHRPPGGHSELARKLSKELNESGISRVVIRPGRQHNKVYTNFEIIPASIKELGVIKRYLSNSGIGSEIRMARMEATA